MSRRVLLVAALALVFAASAMVETGVATWGVLYLRAEVGLGVLAGVSAYVVGNSIATAVVAKWEGELRPEAEAQAEIDADEGETAAAPA